MQVCEWRGLIGWARRVDERGRRHHDEFGLGGQRGVNEESGRVGGRLGRDAVARAELVVIGDEGHGGATSSYDVIVAALDRFAP